MSISQFAGILMIVGLVLIGYGVANLCTPVDELWTHHRARMLRRGLQPERTPEWERAAHTGGWRLLIYGCILAFMPLGAVLLWLMA